MLSAGLKFQAAKTAADSSSQTIAAQTWLKVVTNLETTAE